MKVLWVELIELGKVVDMRNKEGWFEKGVERRGGLFEERF